MKTLYATVATLALATALPMGAMAQDATQPTAGEQVGQAVDATTETAKDAAEAVADAAKDAANAVADAVKDGAAATEDAAKDAAAAADEAAADAAAATEEAADDAAKAADEAGEDAAAAADEARDEAARAAAAAAENAEQAADEAVAEVETEVAAATEAMFDTGALGEHAQLASTIMGREIWTTAGTEAQPIDEMQAIESVPGEWKSIGDVGDMVLDDDGAVVAYVADVGGFLGLGSKPVLLKTDALQQVMVGDNLVFVTSYSEEALKALPDFKSETVEAK